MLVYSSCYALRLVSHLLSVPGASPQSSWLQAVGSAGAELHWLAVDLRGLIGGNNGWNLPKVEALVKDPIYQLVG